jgi:DNA processing protein
MKELTLTPAVLDRFAKLKKHVGLLHYQGLDLESYGDAKFVAIVGTRKITPYGKSVTRQFAEELARAGVVIVSGLAIGVDSLAQNSALEVGGKSIAVLPSGLDAIYPTTNRPLAEKIANGAGTLVSEYDSDHTPRKVEFLERNRIIAALSDIVLIPEAAAQSGSLNTAQHAKSIGVPICAVPGNINSPMSEGTNYLLKNGAHTITSAQDILSLIGGKPKKQLELDLTGADEQETLVLQKIALGFHDGASLQTETELSTMELQTTLSMLEVQGRIIIDELGVWRLA